MNAEAGKPVQGRPARKLADPKANRFDWWGDIRPAGPAMPEGCVAVKMANATHGAIPGQVLVFPLEEGRALVRAGLAREVLAR